MPEFDNLYLDMNGIIHPCTHGDDGAVVRMSEEQMFVKIGKFVDELMKIVKPQKLLFLAVDGCAPRAKMNQQRQRRFRAAQEQSRNLVAARERGEEIPAEPFDSNCITPGTKFMARLTEFLNYYIRSKIKDDANWQRPRIILSGAEVPGASARVRFTVSGERRSWARRVALICGEPSAALAARERARRTRGGCWRVEAPPCRFLNMLPRTSYLCVPRATSAYLELPRTRDLDLEATQGTPCAYAYRCMHAHNMGVDVA